MNRSNKTLISFLTISTIIIIAILVASHFFTAQFDSKYYETNDIADYMNIVGNYNNTTPRAFISSFFPETIKDSFEDVVYHYKAQKGSSYAYEAYLEIRISDSAEYQRYVAEITNEAYEDCPSFAYDKRYQQYVVCNDLLLGTGEDFEYIIHRGKFGRILFSGDDQRIIFVAIGLHDGATSVDNLSYFFSRFNIDPADMGKVLKP